ncbi:rapid alkalinization factor-like isoform X2 [Musa acuminata AAA Group]|uniref:rapid alkalinization factor-like isoform X2 n=2 Tax=Musa acuminata AAA Group TaxID=214697 RepID=UPI0031D82ED6
MARLTALPRLALAVILVFFLVVAEGGSSGGAGDELAPGWIPAGSGCRGSIAECLAGEEFELGTEVTRRILARSYYISYNALRRDSVPCSRRGASYYNCRPGARANPYSRSCSAITRCRRF